MKHRLRIRRAGAVIAAAVAASAAAPAPAEAWTNSYCGVLINSWSWCGDGSNHTYDSNKAIYSGSGNVWVCERLLWADSSTMVAGYSCGWNQKLRGYGTNTSSLYEAEVTHDSGAARHTITGVAVA